MGWVLLGEQSEVVATLQASGNPYNPSHAVTTYNGSLYFPDGQYARMESWSLDFSRSCRIAIGVTADAVPAPAETVIGGGFSAGEIDLPYSDSAGEVVIENTLGEPRDSVVEVSSLTYEPAFAYGGSGQLPPNYNCWVYVWQDGGPSSQYNCACDDGQPTVTLQQMRNRLARRLGFSVQVSMGVLPPGMPELLDDFIRSTHELMYQRYSVMRLRRMFTWDMVAGQRFYDIDGNRDDCPRILNPDKLEWVGISQGDSSWRPLVCGINPVLYGSAATGIPSHYEIRQCIEVWPAPTDDAWQLRIKGDFGPTTLEADDDVLTVDPEAVFLQALANAKAHYGQADATNYASQATAYVRSRVAGSHQTRRYIPGSCVQPPAVRPLLKED